MLLQSPIENLPNTSSITIRKLKELEINSYWDLINYFPYRYENYSMVSAINKIQMGEVVTIKGQIKEAKNIYTRRSLTMQKIKLIDSTGSLDLTWYNQPYLLRILKAEDYLSVSGLVTRFKYELGLEPKDFEVLKNINDETIHTGRIVPVYSEKNGLSAKTIRSKIHYIVKNIGEIAEILPTDVVGFNNLVDQQNAYKNIHFPSSFAMSYKARERLAFEELFVIMLSTALIRREWDGEKITQRFDNSATILKKLNQFISDLPFRLTTAQKKATGEILDDMRKIKPMNRFLQGEVGSGKTVVAAIASYFAYLNGFQSLFMAPTEILAGQHFQTIRTMFQTSGVGKAVPKLCLLTSSNRVKKSGLVSADIIIGTQALLNEKIDFGRVGLVIVDEQHRFGVKQRAMLKDKAVNPHLLTMTATPIPRTVLLTLYGELDLSVIDEMPVGRIPIKTYLVPKEKRKSAYDWIRTQIKKNGTQIFVICPMIEESAVETMQTLRAAKKEFEYLSKEVFPDLKIALMHGKLKGVEKNLIMQDFKNKKSDILVSTSVVEVGIDIPNAAIILIEGAERFGLAQLHQLRGRVGRGEKQSFCLLFSESFDEKSLERLKLFSKTTSGIQLAEYDLKIRGPGDIYGEKQSGYINLKIASLADVNLINKSKNAVSFFLEKYNIEDYQEIENRLEEIKKKQISRD